MLPGRQQGGAAGFVCSGWASPCQVRLRQKARCSVTDLSLFTPSCAAGGASATMPTSGWASRRTSVSGVQCTAIGLVTLTQLLGSSCIRAAPCLPHLAPYVYLHCLNAAPPLTPALVAAPPPAGTFHTAEQAAVAHDVMELWRNESAQVRPFVGGRGVGGGIARWSCWAGGGTDRMLDSLLVGTSVRLVLAAIALLLLLFSAGLAGPQLCVDRLHRPAAAAEEPV